MLHFLAIYNIIIQRISYVDAVSDTPPPPKKTRKSKLYHLFFYAIIILVKNKFTFQNQIQYK